MATETVIGAGEPPVTAPDPALTVAQAMNLVMRDVTVLRKQSRNKDQNFNFRGIDATMNVLGPAFRNHGVLCIPRCLSIDHERVPTKSGAQMTVTRVMVEFVFYGPAGDTLSAIAPGESFDSGDKSTAKAMSVALRTCLLQAFTLPTDEPDPDEHTFELGDTGQGQRQQPQQGQRQQRPNEDPWKIVALSRSQREFLAAQLRASTEDELRAGFYTARDAQAAQPHLMVQLGPDITRDEAELLNMRGPLPLEEVCARISTHFKVEGYSVRDHLSSDVSEPAAPSGEGYSG